MRISPEKLAAHGLRNTGQISAPFSFEPPVSLQRVSIFGDVFVGRHTYMNDGMIREKVRIGRFCSIGRRVVIAAGDHPLDCLTTHPFEWRGKTKPAARSQRRGWREYTEIGNDVWIGDGAVILAGVQVGTGAVVGANAVVTRDVDPYTVVVGVPATPLRRRFEEGVCEQLLDSAWWNLPDEALTLLDMSDIAECIRVIPELKLRYEGAKHDLVVLEADQRDVLMR